MTKGQIGALIFLAIIFIAAMFFLAKNLKVTTTSTQGGSTTTSTGGIGDVILAWFTGKK